MLILWEEEEDKPEYYQYGINTTKKKIFLANSYLSCKSNSLLAHLARNTHKFVILWALRAISLFTIQ